MLHFPKTHEYSTPVDASLRFSSFLLVVYITRYTPLDILTARVILTLLAILTLLRFKHTPTLHERSAPNPEARIDPVCRPFNHSRSACIIHGNIDIFTSNIKFSQCQYFSDMTSSHSQRPIQYYPASSEMPDLAGILYKPAPSVMPGLAGIRYTPAPSTSPVSRLIPPAETQTHWRRLLPLVFGNSWFRDEKDSFVLNLPPELLLIIGSELSDASLASLALTCKGLLSIFSDFPLFSRLQLPFEQPLAFQSAEMSRPRVYQFARWEFLRFLERDLKGTWYLCSECFTLHPPHMYSDVVTMFGNSYDIRDPELRTCRQWRQNLCDQKYSVFAPSGIVDLCPCIKLTMGKKRQIEAQLRGDARKIHDNGRPAADFWWHKCRHVYGGIEVELQIGLFLYDGAEYINPTNRAALGTHIYNDPPTKGDLGALLEYRLIFPSKSETESPRLLCPHLNLVRSIQHLLRCGEKHPVPWSVCQFCHDIQFCKQCRTKVLDLRKAENIATNMVNIKNGLVTMPRCFSAYPNQNKVSCSFRVERCLDGNFWPMHTVFPFARRQVPLQRSSPSPFGIWK